MAHEMARGGVCGRPDGHNGWHRSLESMEIRRAFSRRWNETHPEEKAAFNRAWIRSHPIEALEAMVRSNARRRARRFSQQYPSSNIAQITEGLIG